MKNISLCLSLAFILAGCAMHPAEVPLCPETGYMPYADQAAFFKEGAADNTLENVDVTAELKNLRGHCAVGKNGRVKVDLTMDIFAQRKSAIETEAGQSVSYFVAVLSPDEEILQRVQDSAQVRFDAGQAVAQVEEEYSIVLPVMAPVDAGAYKVVLGFTLTPEQLDFNQNRTRVTPEK